MHTPTPGAERQQAMAERFNSELALFLLVAEDHMWWLYVLACCLLACLLLFFLSLPLLFPPAWWRRQQHHSPITPGPIDDDITLLTPLC